MLFPSSSKLSLENAELICLENVHNFMGMCEIWRSWLQWRNLMHLPEELHVMGLTVKQYDLWLNQPSLILKFHLYIVDLAGHGLFHNYFIYFNGFSEIGHGRRLLASGPWEIGKMIDCVLLCQQEGYIETLVSLCFCIVNLGWVDVASIPPAKEWRETSRISTCSYLLSRDRPSCEVSFPASNDDCFRAGCTWMFT